MAAGQDADAAARQKLSDAAKEGLPLNTVTQGIGAKGNGAKASGNVTPKEAGGPAASETHPGTTKSSQPPTSTVADSVTVEAVLLPEKVCRRVFGKEISQNYTAIELTISDRSRNASVVVQSLFIDYSAWLLNGVGGPAGPSENARQQWEAETKRNQISSVEYRVARGQMLDRQPWTLRNTVLHALQLAGTIATAYTFVTTDLDITRGISAFSGQVVPGMDKFWPDSTIGQMNRISDFGFRVNKIIAKESSDIVVAFFPIDRFLTPSLKKLFLKSPAMFFSPSAMILDTESRKELAKIIDPLMAAGATAGSAPVTLDMLAAHQIQGKTLSDEEQHLNAYLSRASLNNVKILVSGIMTVDVGDVAAQIDSVDCGEGTNPQVWAQPGEVNCVIKGVFLTNGTPKIDGASGLGISDPIVDEDQSSDSELHFKITLSKALPDIHQLTFTVTKTDKANKTISSPPKLLQVPVPGTDSGGTGGKGTTGPAGSEPVLPPAPAGPK